MNVGLPYVTNRHLSVSVYRYFSFSHTWQYMSITLYPRQMSHDYDFQKKMPSPFSKPKTLNSPPKESGWDLDEVTWAIHPTFKIIYLNSLLLKKNDSDDLTFQKSSTWNFCYLLLYGLEDMTKPIEAPKCALWHPIRPIKTYKSLTDTLT